MNDDIFFRLARENADFHVGQRVWYRGGMFRQPVLCTITGRDTENGVRVFDNDTGHWGYASQYVRAELPLSPQDREAWLDALLGEHHA